MKLGEFANEIGWIVVKWLQTNWPENKRETIILQLNLKDHYHLTFLHREKLESLWQTMILQMSIVLEENPITIMLEWSQYYVMTKIADQITVQSTITLTPIFYTCFQC